MNYFVTGGTGFIGRYLIGKLLARGGTVYALVREESKGRLEDLIAGWGTAGFEVVPVIGDISEPMMGLDEDRIEELTGKIDHFFHLAAIYDMKADAATIEKGNVDGTRNAVQLANQLGVGCFHLASSIAAAGLYRGTWRENMFEQATDLDQHAYFRTKHESEKIVREDLDRPFRVYRPGVVVGDSETGEMDKIDGPYYFFSAIKRFGSVLPDWLPTVGIEGRRINVVPVDFVAAAMDHIAHLEGRDGQTFHLTDPDPLTAGQIINLFAREAHAPQMSVRLDSRLLDLVPSSLTGGLAGLGLLAPARLAARLALDELGIPSEVLVYVNYPTDFDCSNTLDALAGTDISVPPLAAYADRLWEYWEQNLDPGLPRDRTLTGAVRGRNVMITGASSGIGRATALKVGEAGGRVLLVARSTDKLAELKEEIERTGGLASIHPCDLSDVEDVERMAGEVLEEHGHVDILVNNAGRSIRRSVGLSYDRFHDYERTMQLNYFGSLKLILALLPKMRERKSGHIINVSSIGVQTNVPRFSAYIASKAALDAFGRSVASEVIDDGVHITAIYMPLVRTPMIAPTRMYDAFPTSSPDDAAEMITGAMIDRPKKVATALGNFGELLYALSPKTSDRVLNMGYKLFPESKAASAKTGTEAGTGTGTEAEVEQQIEATSAEAVAFAHLLRGVHW
jgi:NAD(P)-dependent dehydrogenase (short-subunit alcohol dehydrogenase family)